MIVTYIHVYQEKYIYSHIRKPVSWEQASLKKMATGSGDINFIPGCLVSHCETLSIFVSMLKVAEWAILFTCQCC